MTMKVALTFACMNLKSLQNASRNGDYGWHNQGKISCFRNKFHKHKENAPRNGSFSEHFVGLKHRDLGASFILGDLFIQIFFIYILQHHCTNFQRKSEQCDESVCIVMIVLITGCETCQRLTVERVWRSCAGFDDVSLCRALNFTSS